MLESTLAPVPELALHDASPYHIGASPLICSDYQCTGFFMVGTSVMKELTFKLSLEKL